MRRRSQGPGRATRDGQTSTRTAVRGSNYVSETIRRLPNPYTYKGDLFRNRVFSDVIELKRGQSGGA